MRAIFLLCAIGLAAVANLLVWWAAYRPVTVAQTVTEPLSSLSFAPFRRGQSPLVRVYPTAAEIEADLRILSGKVRSVRTYTSLEGMEVLPHLAPRHGIRITQGAWLGTRPIVNAQEISALIEAANRHPEAIERVIVGNEVLLRNDLTQRELVNYIRAVRSAVKQPVSYADVWERWMDNPALADEVDFITIHILPYWEDHPVGVARAREHISDVYDTVRRRFPGKPILIGETGWPTDGRMRNDAAPGLVEHARFVAMFVDLAKERGFDYNLIEAFDQPWKSLFEGTVGKSWGTYYRDRAPKYADGAGVSDDPDWLRKAAASAVLSGLLVLLLGIRRRELTWRRLVVLALFSQAAISALVYGFAIDFGRSLALAPVAAEMFDSAFARAGSAPFEAMGLVHRYAFYPQRLIGTGLWGLLGAMFAVYFVVAIANSLAGRAPVPQRVRRIRGSVAMAVSDGIRATLRRPVLMMQVMFLAFAVLAIWHVWALALDGRYRDFPVGNFLLPALVPLAWKLVTACTPPPGAPERHRLAEALSFGRILGLVGDEPAVPLAPGYSRFGPIWPELAICLGLLSGAAAMVHNEGIVNREALAWAGLCVLMAVPFLATIRLSLALTTAEQPPESFTGKW